MIRELEHNHPLVRSGISAVSNCRTVSSKLGLISFHLNFSEAFWRQGDATNRYTQVPPGPTSNGIPMLPKLTSTFRTRLPALLTKNLISRIFRVIHLRRAFAQKSSSVASLKDG